MTNTFASLQERLDDQRRHKRQELITNVVGLTVVLSVVAAVCAAAWLYGRRVQTVASVEPAGELLRAHFNSSLLDDNTTVETSLGVFKVGGSFQAIKGRQVQIETRSSGHRYLCDPATRDCRLLAQ